MKIEHKDDYFSLISDNVEIGFLRYGIVENIMYINGVVVDPKFRNRGLAKDLLEESVAYAKKNNLKIIPRCSYVVKAFDRGGYEDIDAR